MSTKRLLVIVGPTGSGKTDLSIRLAGHYAAPILSTDSRQVYRGMPIGTAQPTFDQLQAVEHHFIASHDIKDYLSCGEYEVQALARLEKLFAGHDYVVAVGGAGLYVRALCEGMDDLPQADESLREEMDRWLAEEGLGALAEKLRELDPEYYRTASLRMNSEQKFKEGDALRQSFETTSNAEAMFFTDQCQVYKTRLGEFDDAKASVLGDYLPTKLKMDAGENVIFMVLPGPDYAGSLLFFYENGKAARIEMKAYQTASNRRKLTGAYSDKSPLACIRRLDEDCELAVYSNEPRCLIFHTALLAPKTTRSAQGVAVMTLKPKYHLETVLLSEETSITNRTRYRVRAIPAAGALVKEEDSEDQQISLL